MVRTKVFVGNLDFKTQESELAEEFAAAGTVISANIITRGPRSLGYGFVELDSEESAENAVTMLNKKKVNGREINVEIAKERPEGLPSQNNNEEGAPRRRFRPRFRKPFGAGPTDNNESENTNPGNDPSGPPRRRFRKTQPHDQEHEEGQDQAQRPPRVMRPRRPIEERSNTPSKTTLFVANLPFALDDVEFGQVFKDDALAFKSAHVVKKRNNRSKGFGFVEFDTEADQQKALLAVNNKSVKGRELIVKVALTEQKHREDSNVPREESKQEKPIETRKEEKKPEPKKEEKKTPDQPRKEEKIQEKKPVDEKKAVETKKDEKKPVETKKDDKPTEKKPVEAKKKPVESPKSDK